jgi:hypothetical protein
MHADLKSDAADSNNDNRDFLELYPRDRFVHPRHPRSMLFPRLRS